MSQERGVSIDITVDPGWVRSVRKEMDARGWNQTRLAREAGTSKATITRIFTGGVVTGETTLAVAKALGLRDHPASLVSQELRQWLVAGALLQEHAPKDFAKLLAAVMKRAAELATFERAITDLVDGTPGDK